MADWNDLSPKLLSEWIRANTRLPAPPAYRLRSVEATLEDEGWRKQFSAEGRRHPISGILEIELPRSLRGLEATSPLPALHRLAAWEDRRDFHPVKGPSSHALLAESESSLPNGLPIVGPGGRIALAGRADAFVADIVVRRRQQPLPSRWRPHREMLNTLQRRIEASRSGQRVVGMAGALGYFELSKYERQEVLRPVIILSLRIATAVEPEIEWGDSIVEPVTRIEASTTAELRGYADQS